MKTYDITYTDLGLFTMFIDNTPEGREVIDQMFAQTGSNKVMTVEAKAVIAKMRKAGYSVSKNKQPKQDIQDILSELEAL